MLGAVKSAYSFSSPFLRDTTGTRQVVPIIHTYGIDWFEIFSQINLMKLKQPVRST